MLDDRYAALVAALRTATLDGPGTLDPAIRRAASAQSAAVPAALRAYVTKVAQHAYRVTDEDVAALRRAGFSEDQIFEVTVSTATGAALARLEAGLAALRGGK